MIAALVLHAILLAQMPAVEGQDVYACGMKRVDPVNYGNPSNPTTTGPAMLVAFAVPSSTEVGPEKQSVPIDIGQVQFLEVGSVFEGRPITNALRIRNGLMFSTEGGGSGKIMFGVMDTDKEHPQTIVVRELGPDNNPFAYFLIGGCQKFGSIADMRAEMAKVSQ
jgi:hypothetical protein